MKRVIGAIAACLLVPVAANAATVSHTASADASGNPFQGVFLPLALPLFDASLGVLTGASLSYAATGTSSAGGDSCDVDVIVDVYEDDTFFVSDLAAAASNFESCETSADLAGTVIAGAFDLPYLIGPGTFTLDFSAWTTAEEGDLMALSAFAEVVYDYTPDLAAMPLPAALPLLVAGMGGLGLLARRRRAA